MRALTIQQPYAELVARGLKRVENRTWQTHYRGELVIHAGASQRWLAEADPLDIERAGEDLAFGAIIAVADLVDCLSIRDLTRDQSLFKHDLAEHEYATGPWCWVLDNVRRLQRPIIAPGRQSIWTVPPDLARKIARQL